MAEAISQHKKMAMGDSVPLASGKSVIPKYAKGGAVMAEGKAATLINDSARKNPLPRPMPGNEGKIATLKKGGAVPKFMKKAAGRGR